MAVVVDTAMPLRCVYTFKVRILTGNISEHICHGCVTNPIQANDMKAAKLMMAIQPPAIQRSIVALTGEGARLLREGIDSHNKAKGEAANRHRHRACKDEIPAAVLLAELDKEGRCADHE